jgi:hypothetical protein
VKRTHDDLLGVLNCSVTAEELERSIPEVDLNDCDNDHDGDVTGPSLPHGHRSRYQTGRRQVDTAEAAYKSEKIAILKSRFNESLNVLEAATSHEEVDNFFGIDNCCFAIKRQLPALPARTVQPRAQVHIFFVLPYFPSSLVWAGSKSCATVVLPCASLCSL